MLALLYVVFILSGAAGLIYESIWTRYLGLFVGHSAYAQVIVLVIFLGGMSLGALLVGRHSERLKRPLFWYAIVELATGVIGLVFHDVFVATTRFAYASVFPAVGLRRDADRREMGHCQPSHSAAVDSARHDVPADERGRRCGAHSGAAGRALVDALFREQPRRGGRRAARRVLARRRSPVCRARCSSAAMHQSSRSPVIVIVALRIERSEAASPAMSPQTTETSVSGLSRPSLWRLLLAVSFGTALSSFIYEIGWIRMLALVLGSATHSFELMLSAFILGSRCGALWVRRRADAERRLAPPSRLRAARDGIARDRDAAGLPRVVRLDGRRSWRRSRRRRRATRCSAIARYALCLAVMLPATFCAGMTLPLITRVLVGAGVGERAIGQVYGVNTFGSIVGAGLAGLVLLPLLGLKWLLIAGASVDIALGIALLASDGADAFAARRDRGRAQGCRSRCSVPRRSSSIARAIELRSHCSDERRLSLRFGAGARLARRAVLQGRPHGDGERAPHCRDTGGLTLGTNGKPDASLGPEWLNPNCQSRRRGPFTHDAPTQLFVPLVALAHAPQAREAAVIGHGSGMTTHALLGSATLKHVVTIEIEPEMIKASRAFYPANRARVRRSALDVRDRRRARVLRGARARSSTSSSPSRRIRGCRACPGCSRRSSTAASRRI